MTGLEAAAELYDEAAGALEGRYSTPAAVAVLATRALTCLLAADQIERNRRREDGLS